MTTDQQASLALLLDFENQIRQLQSLMELHYFIANETYKVTPYRQAVVFDAHGKVTTMSGVATVEKNAPFVQWLQGACWEHISGFSEPKTVKIDGIEGAGTDWLPTHLAIFPLIAPNGVKYGTLLMAKEKVWTQADAVLLTHLSQAYAHNWSLHTPKPKISLMKKLPGKVKITGAVLLMAALFIPVDLSVLAQAEVIAQDPVVMRSPMTGIMERILVKPNQRVKIDTVLFQLDQTDLKNEHLVAQKTLQSLTAQYRQTTRLALSDPKGRNKLTIISGQIKEQQAQIAQLNQRLSRTIVKAPKTGTVVVDKIEDWLGKPVQVGERVLLLANEKKLEIEAWLPVADTIELKEGSEVRIFLNSSPMDPVEASLKYISYEAQMRPDGILAHRLLAEIATEQDLPRLGARGTARLEGNRVPFIYWMFRRPMATIRQFIGL